MPHYLKLGNIPTKRHTVFRQPNGEMYAEELMGSDGFSGPSSLLYHIHPPTRVLETKTLRTETPEEEHNTTLRMRHFQKGSVNGQSLEVIESATVRFFLFFFVGCLLIASSSSSSSSFSFLFLVDYPSNLACSAIPTYSYAKYTRWS